MWLYIHLCKNKLESFGLVWKTPEIAKILASALNLGHFPNFNRSPFSFCSHNVIERRVLVDDNFSVYAAPTYGKWERIYIIHITLKLQNYVNNRHDFGFVGFLEEKKDIIKASRYFLISLTIHLKSKVHVGPFPLHFNCRKCGTGSPYEVSWPATLEKKTVLWFILV
jgi:hypothetical protein